MSVTAALREQPVRDKRGPREVLSGNICRCNRLPRLIQAVLDAGSAA